ncbi:MAG: response regulator transcription factor [Candidatus Sericytochromatia bacterium]|nr:response regulator transcription factor [Candidatus Sericytochromatia bacterium]
MISILIADDHAIVREGLKQILSGLPDFKVSAEASSGYETIQKLEEMPIDLVILDINLGDQNGLEVLKQIRQKWASLPVLILTMHSEKQYATRMLKAGASGFLNKGSASEELVNALRKIARGGKYITESLAEQLVMEMGQSTAVPHERLSDREFEIFRQIAIGKKNKEIAEELYLSEKTVSTYQSRILEKMNLANRAAIIHYALENSLI